MRRGFFAYHQIPEEIGCVSCAETGDEKADKDDSAQQCQFGTTVEPGNKGGPEKEQSVECKADECAEPEYGIEVFMPCFLFNAERTGKSAFLQIAGQGGEYRQHGHHSIIFDGEDVGHDDTDNHRHDLLGAIAQGCPEKAFGCAFFEVGFVLHLFGVVGNAVQKYLFLPELYQTNS